MVTINNITEYEWRIILSSLKSEYNNPVLSEVFPRRREEIGDLIRKIEGFNY
ncbi:hypothetical protein [Bacillus infantis]|uniref:hypothetical protein n=1 Tax=Bacillus infantis TaxID=324767 RepID=UPI003CEBF81F